MSACFPCQPRLAIPVLRTASLARSLAWYRDVLGFEQRQQVPHVLALLRLRGVELQLWQVRNAVEQDCLLQVDPGRGCIFACHACLARSARAWIGPPPRLRPWGAWEFALTDPDGHRLRFEQWVAPAPGASPPGRPSGGG
jgi:catechol 2,3-dioxygenase-like lactoylglutathione lyase family enzyme